MSPQRPIDMPQSEKEPSAGSARIRPFSRSLPMQLMRARETVMQRFRPHLNAHGLTDQQWRIIRALNEVEEIEILDLGERCCIHAASLSRILPKLASAGLINRRVNKQDQRRILVSLAPDGRRLFKTIAPESEEIYAELTRVLGPELVTRIYRALDEMIETLSESQMDETERPQGPVRRKAAHPR